MRYKNAECVWQFHTRNLNVKLLVSDCIDDPRDSITFETEDQAAKFLADIGGGRLAWFDALVVVEFRDGTELGWDSLGSNSYNSVEEFITSHRDPDPLNRNSSIMRAQRGGNVVICHYFPGMVQEACASARKHLAELQTIRLRHA